ncbi:MAG: aspartate ammonia-lyase [Clostridiales bacterium]|nr:aspartate ammonia-lyase [Clostridiales bacterium]
MRMERDSLGEKAVPADAYWGVQTQRAVENFPISGYRLPFHMIWAMAHIKKAAALVHKETGRLAPELADAIVAAADEVIAGRFNDHFVVDAFQAGAGTSFNMNTNEVIANRANEILGQPRGQYRPIHPNDHVNMAQSTNDSFPTAMRLATLRALEGLYPVLDQVAATFERKAKEFWHVIKAGRTHLQDAMPVRLGQEFLAYSRIIQRGRRRLQEAAADLHELGIGGTAVGSGVNAEKVYPTKVVEHLARLTGFPLRPGENLFALMQSLSDFSHVSGALRDLALDISKIANDLRLLSSGPSTGLAEIRLPAVQPGSSIMPGKVNPSMLEMLNQVCYRVVGNDAGIAAATEAGQLELNVMMPVVAFMLLESIEILKNALKATDERTFQGIQANEKRARELVEKSAALATALTDYIGYLKAAEIAKEVVETGRSLRDVVLEKGLLDEATLDKVLDYAAMTEPGVPGRSQ